MEKQTNAPETNASETNASETNIQKTTADITTSKLEIEQKKLNSVYMFDCVGKMHGCDEKTNGTQYCCKYYCPHELEHDTLN